LADLSFSGFREFGNNACRENLRLGLPDVSQTRLQGNTAPPAPHIHVRCADGECKFWLDPGALARKRGVPPLTGREMDRLVYEYGDLLLEKYDEHCPPRNRSRGDESVD
jgi:hypothetical protein